MTAHERALQVLAEMEAKASAATEGPWQARTGKGMSSIHVLKSASVIVARMYGSGSFKRRLGAIASANFIASVRTDAPLAYSIIRAMLEMHTPKPLRKGYAGSRCRNCDRWWPCPTVRAITEKLEGK